MMKNSMPDQLIQKSKDRGIIAGPEIISGMLYLIDYTDTPEVENGAVMRFDTTGGESVASLVPLPEAEPVPVMSMASKM